MNERKNVETPIMMMVGSEDYVLGADGVEACRQFSSNSSICTNQFAGKRPFLFVAWFCSFCFCRLSFVYELLHCFKRKCRTGILRANLC